MSSSAQLQVTLNDAIVEDVSWDLKRANAIRITSAIGFKIVLVCESPQEHKQVNPRSAVTTEWQSDCMPSHHLHLE